MKTRVLNQNAFWKQVYTCYKRSHNEAKAMRLMMTVRDFTTPINISDFPASDKQAYIEC